MTLESSIAALESSGLIRLVSADHELEYQFRHALIQDAAYASLLKSDRRRLHHLVGEALERLHPDRLDELAGLLAQHFNLAGDAQRALHYLLKAGYRALTRFAIQEAISFFQQAEDLARSNNWSTQLRLSLEGLGEAYRFTGDNLMALACLREAQALSESRFNRADLLNQQGYIYMVHMNLREESLACFKQALAELQDHTRSVEMARLYINLGFYYGILDAGENQALAERYLHLALRILEGTFYYLDLAYCYAYLGLATVRRSPEIGLGWGRKALELANRFGLEYAAEPANVVIGHAYSNLGENDQAVAYYRAALENNNTTGYVYSTGNVCSYLSAVYLEMGQVQQAIEVGERGLAAWEKLDHPYGRVWMMPFLSVCYELIGERSSAARYLQQAQSDPSQAGAVSYSLVCAYARAGKQEKALEILRSSIHRMTPPMRESLRTDDDTRPLHTDAQFLSLLAGSTAPERAAS